MIFDTSIPKATGHQFNFPPHPTSASTLPGENRTNEICTKMNNKRQQTGD